MRRFVVACLLVGASAVAYAEDWEYTVRPGDNLWDLAARYCGSVTYAARLARHNGVSASGAPVLRTGRRLTFPVEWLVRQPVSANLVFVSGDVSIERQSGRTAAVAGIEIEMNQALITGDGHATVSFADGTELVVGPDSTLAFDLMTAYGDTGMVDTKLRLVRGRVDSRVKPAQGSGSNYRINTPLGVAAVRGTLFRVRSRTEEARGPLMFNETIEGDVAVDDDATQSSTRVLAGYGVVADATAQPPQKEALLPPAVLQSVAAATANDQLEWSVVPSAESYLVRVYAGGDRRQPVSQSLVIEARYALSGLTPGQYGFGVRAIALSGLEGLEASADVRLVADRPEAREATFSGQSLVLHWSDAEAASAYRLELARDGAFASPSIHFSTAKKLELPAPAPGLVFWRVARADDGLWSGARTVEVPPSAPVVSSVSAVKKAVSVQWTMVDGAVEYQLQLSKDPAFSKPLLSTTTTQTDAVITVAEFGRHHVRVRAVADGIAGPFSAIVEHDVSAPKPRWWPLGLFAVPLLAL